MDIVEKINLFLEKNVPTDPGKWSYYKGQAKKKFDVYPSAYANAWAAKKYKEAGGGWRTEESVNEFIMPRDVDSKMKELGISKIPISSKGENILKGMVKEKFLDKVTNADRLIYFYQSLGDDRFGYGIKGKPLSPLVDRFLNDLMSDSISFGGKLAAYQVAMTIKDMKVNGEEIDSPYEMMKEYFKNFGMNYNRNRVFDSAIRNLEEWMKRNKIQESVNEASIDKTSQNYFKLVDIVRGLEVNQKNLFLNYKQAQQKNDNQQMTKWLDMMRDNQQKLNKARKELEKAEKQYFSSIASTQKSLELDYED